MATPDTSNGGRATKTDVRNLKAQARRHDEEHDRAYQAGLTGDEPPGFDAPDSVLDAYQQGVAERGAKKSSAGSSSSETSGQHHAGPGRTAPSASGARKRPNPISKALGAPTVTRASEQGASLLLGAIAYALGVSYIAYGWPGVTGWFSAKFINKVTVGKAAGPGTPAPASLIPNANPATHGPVAQPGGMFA